MHECGLAFCAMLRAVEVKGQFECVFGAPVCPELSVLPFPVHVRIGSLLLVAFRPPLEDCMSTCAASISVVVLVLIFEQG